MKIEIIKCLSDNFSYLLINEKNLDACVVDPGEAQPILKYIENLTNIHQNASQMGPKSIPNQLKFIFV